VQQAVHLVQASDHQRRLEHAALHHRWAIVVEQLDDLGIGVEQLCQGAAILLPKAFQTCSRVRQDVSKYVLSLGRTCTQMLISILVNNFHAQSSCHKLRPKLPSPPPHQTTLNLKPLT